MAQWTTARADLRLFLSDSDRDNLVKDKPVIGETNGQNRVFYTFDDRLTTSGYQNTQSRPLRVFQDGAELAASGINVTDAYRGEFQLMAVPSGTVTVRASYYFQHHLDAELDTYLAQAINLVNVSTVADTAVGLQASVLHIAASFAHERSAQRWYHRKSDQFMTHDTPKEEANERVKFHRDTAQYMMTQGLELRRAFYDLRHDRGRAPAYKLLKRTPSPWGPRR